MNGTSRGDDLSLICPLRPRNQTDTEAESAPRLLSVSTAIYQFARSPAPVYKPCPSAAVCTTATKIIHIHYIHHNITNIHTNTHAHTVYSITLYMTASICVNRKRSGKGWMKYLTCGRRQNRDHS